MFKLSLFAALNLIIATNGASSRRLLDLMGDTKQEAQGRANKEDGRRHELQQQIHVDASNLPEKAKACWELSASYAQENKGDAFAKILDQQGDELWLMAEKQMEEKINSDITKVMIQQRDAQGADLDEQIRLNGKLIGLYHELDGLQGREIQEKARQSIGRLRSKNQDLELMKQSQAQHPHFPGRWDNEKRKWIFGH